MWRGEEGGFIHFNNPSREETEFEIQIELGLGLGLTRQSP